MSITRARLGLGFALLALAMLPARRVMAQEIGPYVGGGVGGVRDIRRPFGGGLSGTLLFHDWIGVRGDAGVYWTLDHRLSDPQCHAGIEGPICTTYKLSSHSHFPLLDGLLLLRAHVPGKGIRVEVGAGPSWVDVTNEIRTSTDSVFSPRVTSSRAGAAVMVGLLGHPQWKVPITFEGSYVYHMTAKFGSCISGTNTPAANDPICGQHLNFHELRFTALYRPRVMNR